MVVVVVGGGGGGGGGGDLSSALRNASNALRVPLRCKQVSL